MKKAGKAGASKGKAGAPKASSEPAKKAGSAPKPGEIEQLFNQFASESHSDSAKTEIEPTGLQELCEALHVDPAADVAVLVLAWKCKTRTMGTITKEEFLRGMQELHVDSLSSLVSRTTDMREMVRDATSPQFRDFFRFVFEISREPGSKVLELDVALALLDMLLGRSFSLSAKFQAFLRRKEGLRALSVDQWQSFLEFCKQHDSGLQHYDSDGACKFYSGPVLIDEFVAWLQAGNS
jgi:hypothetical protein